MRKEEVQIGIPIGNNSTYRPIMGNQEPFINYNNGTAVTVDPTMKPMYGDNETQKAGNGRFVVGKYHDWWASFIFLAMSILLIILSCITISDLLNTSAIYTRTFNSHLKIDLGISGARLIFVALAATSAASFAASLLMLLVMYFHPKAYIISVHLFSIFALCGLGVVSFFEIGPGGHVALVCFLTLAIIQAIYLCFSWKYINLSSVLLAFSVKLAFRYPAVILSSCIGFITQCVFLLTSILTTIKICVSFQGENGDLNTLGIILLCIVSLNWYWGVQVIGNVVHVTVAGVAATVYFLGTCMPSNPTWKSFVRATTTSFGSICFGSLLVALVQFLRETIRNSIKRNTILFIFVDCIMDFIEGIMKFFNHYAFTYIAIYGDSYVSSAKKAWCLIKNAPCSVFFNKTLISDTITLSSVIVTCIAYIIMNLLQNLPLPLIIICTIWVFIISLLMLRALNYAETALFVCVAEAPDALQYSEPELHSSINRCFTH